MRRFDWIMEELDFDEPTVTMLVELSDGGRLECTLDETGSEPVLSIVANTDDFEIVEIADPFEQKVAGLFRSGEARYVIRESESLVQWRLNSTTGSTPDQNSSVNRSLTQ
jgi:hypothetical protein